LGRWLKRTFDAHGKRAKVFGIVDLDRTALGNEADDHGSFPIRNALKCLHRRAGARTVHSPWQCVDGGYARLLAASPPWQMPSNRPTLER
jgi:hypothetical protein